VAEPIFLAANNPDLGGGERMLLRHAEVLTDLGRRAVVVSAAGELLEIARREGFETVEVVDGDRPTYMRHLRTWDRREREGLLWCHGLVPSMATAGHRGRVVHLHQQPQSAPQEAALALARRPARAVLVPSRAMTRDVSRARVHLNWTEELPLLGRPDRAEVLRIGFVGRLTTEKGLDVLARAGSVLAQAGHTVQLVVAGDDRHVPAERRDRVLTALKDSRAEVELVGQVERAEVLTRVDVAVFPSVASEPFGLVAAEAMASGVPFVISDAGALPEVAGPDHPWIARSGDADDLARVIGEALATPEDDVRAVTDRARARWEEMYSPEAGRERVHALLDDLGVS
jgi:glycosyltransferase involved in cell wall biosynthesis